MWRTLVFFSGFLPLLFFTTGVTMWIRKRRNRSAAEARKTLLAARKA